MRKIAILFLVLSAVPASARAAEQNTSDAAITGVEGEVTVVRNGASTPASEGMPLKQGDVVKTGPGGAADFSMNGLAGGRLLADGECSLEDPQKKSMRVKLALGKILLNLEKLPEESSFEVETPTAIASVRGTQFSGFVGSRGSSFSVRDDAIQVRRMQGGRPVGDPILIGEGFSCDVGPEGFGRLTSRPATGQELVLIEQVSTVKTCA